MSVTAAGRLPRCRCRGRSEVGRAARRRRRRQRRTVACCCRRLHAQPGQGRTGAVVRAGAGRRAGRCRGAQLRRRERVHRAARLPGHPCHRGVAGRGAAALDHRRRGLLDRPDRGATSRRGAAGRSRRGRRPAVRRRRRRRGSRDHDDRHEAEAVGRDDGQRRHGRRHGQGRRDARPRTGDHARRPHHRCPGRRGRPRPCTAVRHRRDVRPGRLRRLHVDQRHGAAARLWRVRRHPGCR